MPRTCASEWRRSSRPSDLQETVAKLIAGLDRAANDLNVLVQYGRPLSLNKHPGVDLQKLMRGVSTNLPETASGRFKLLAGGGFRASCRWWESLTRPL